VRIVDSVIQLSKDKELPGVEQTKKMIECVERILDEDRKKKSWIL
jgi:hypothetical protein